MDIIFAKFLDKSHTRHGQIFRLLEKIEIIRDQALEYKSSAIIIRLV